ncbi:unnamed protein product [Mytilus edulis]|uniref:Uncharacterized protein n=1 Tax=Mytilus edulis TaxID=6550 RepID=A0A8S3RZI5_MYTED|nr:unnamed protein product [Mytilus edulis]
MNQEDLDVIGVFYTEVTAVTDLLKLLKNRKSRTSFLEVAKYFNDSTDEHLKFSLNLDNIPGIDEESALAIEEREVVDLLMNQEDLDVIGVFYTEVTAVTDLLKLLKNRKSRTSFLEVAKYFNDSTDEHLKFSLNLDNIPGIDEESALAIEEREVVEYLEKKIKPEKLSASLMNQEDLDVIGVFYTEVTAVTDLLKLLKNRKNNIPGIDEESALAIEEREVVEYLEKIQGT